MATKLFPYVTAETCRHLRPWGLSGRAASFANTEAVHVRGAGSQNGGRVAGRVPRAAGPTGTDVRSWQILLQKSVVVRREA
jgi:hypothetical protein